MIPLPAFGIGLLAAFVGFASSVAVVIQGLKASGASSAQASSGVMALSIGMGLCGILLSAVKRMPISVAWSTPGAALLAGGGSIAGGFPAAVGAFLVAAIFCVLCGLWRPLGRWVAAIPAPLANALLAGIMLDLCLAPVRAVAQVPGQALPVVLCWAAVAQIKRLYAVPAAVVVTIAIIALGGSGAPFGGGSLWPHPVLTSPTFSLAGIVGVAIPLFVVTMASQNIPGIAILNLNGFRPAPGLLFTATGLFSLLAAPFGAHAINLAAVTAALCSGPDAGPDLDRRYWAGIVNGAGYVFFGFCAGAVTALVGASQPVLIEAVAGLALLGTLGSSLMAAVTDADTREAAIVTFLVTASGVSILGIGGAFWGLIAGGLLHALARRRRPS